MKLSSLVLIAFVLQNEFVSAEQNLGTQSEIEMVIEPNKAEYKSGEIIQIKGIVFQESEGYLVNFEFYDYSGQAIENKPIMLGSGGNFNFLYKIPKLCQSGTYQIILDDYTKGNTVFEKIKVVSLNPSELDSSEFPKCEPDGELKNCGVCKYKRNGSSGCLIATAAFGSELAPQVQFLREIRDNTLLSTTSGSSFITGFNQLYYSFSPTIADWERENTVFKETVKLFITPMVYSLSIMTLADEGSELRVIALGVSTISLIIGMYVIVPVLIIRKVWNH